ncbi:MAG: hypothetical protein VX594_09540 [Actinomycetota bacterium]|nr:hypothetical protein [Actinomycetota bacterium]
MNAHPTGISYFAPPSPVGSNYESTIRNMVQKSRRGKIRKIRQKRMTISCSVCDVTWRGKPGDRCWSCGTEETIEAVPVQIKIVS